LVAQAVSFEGELYQLQGAFVWFEFGWWNWDLTEWTPSGYWTGMYYVYTFGSCFAAGTPVMTPDGAKPIERFSRGDLILSTPPNDPEAVPVASRVVDVIRRRGQLVGITVGGHVVEATSEHPFYVKGKAWTPAASLAVGDLLRSHDGIWVPVESIVQGREHQVYNLRVDRDASYFVGADDWGFSLLVYGACKKLNGDPNPLFRGSICVSAPVTPRSPGRHG